MSAKKVTSPNGGSTDPYFMVRDEVCKSLERARGLASNPRNTDTLRTTLRSIEWDLEDLEETVNIVQTNRAKFSNVTDAELHRRHAFIMESKQEINQLRQKLSGGNSVNYRQSQVNGSPVAASINTAVSNDSSLLQTQEQQQLLLRTQDERLDQLGSSLSVLKNASRDMGYELEEQARLLDDMGEEMGKAESRLDVTSKKLARVLRMSSEKRQWVAIVVLIVVAVILIILLAVL